jgi:hypothetical protein
LSTDGKGTIKDPFEVFPAIKELPIGESMDIRIKFTPTAVAEYSYNLLFRYESMKMTTKLKAIGGKAIIELDSPLRQIDFGQCRLDKTFVKNIVVNNKGNLFSTFSAGIVEEEKNEEEERVFSADVCLPVTSGVFAPYSRTSIPIHFTPSAKGHAKQRFVVTSGCGCKSSML